MAEKLSLGGREYVHAQAERMPLRQDLFLMQHARHAGLTDASIREGEAPEDFAARLLDSMLTSGRALLLLGAMIVPAGRKPEEWTEETAYETAGHLGGIMNPDEKSRVQSVLVSALFGFFESGLGSWIASARSSVRGEPETKTSTGPTADGIASSERSPVTTPTDAGSSPAGS